MAKKIATPGNPVYKQTLASRKRFKTLPRNLSWSGWSWGQPWRMKLSWKSDSRQFQGHGDVFRFLEQWFSQLQKPQDGVFLVRIQSVLNAEWMNKHRIILVFYFDSCKDLKDFAWKAKTSLQYREFKGWPGGHSGILYSVLKIVLQIFAL